jgi:hypothetical protein
MYEKMKNRAIRINESDDDMTIYFAKSNQNNEAAKRKVGKETQRR